MVLQFLPAIATGLDLIGGYKGLQQQFRPMGATTAEQEQAQALSNAQRLLKSYLNPNDVITRNLAANEGQLIRQDYTRALSDLIRADRRQRLLGRQSFFNPERRDESISKFVTMQAQRAEPAARNAALDRILGAAQGQSNMAGRYGTMVRPQYDRMLAERQRLPGAYGQTADFVRGLPGAVSGLSNLFSKIGGLF